MHVAGKKIIKDFIQEFPDAADAVKTFMLEVKKATRVNPNQIKEQYRSASVISKGCIIFNICGNKYRIVVKIDFISLIARIRWAGRHKEYDKLKIKETECLSSK